ncbi:MAG: hypothetical protein CM15mP33_09070 [Candidatus Neomarinimicrobiota bacterium]|nr:MAG: hypothetical protein CM15mP33_09070 [Candidatus Neomarinimicrobiota bacterium]
MPLFDSKSIIQVLSPIVHSKEQSAMILLKMFGNQTLLKVEILKENGIKFYMMGYIKTNFKKVNVRPASKISTAVLNNYSLDNDKFEIVFVLLHLFTMEGMQTTVGCKRFLNQLQA